MLSVEPSLRAQVGRRQTNTMTKGARALNTNATKFEVLLHVSEREEQSEARAGADSAEKSLKGRFPSRLG